MSLRLAVTLAGYTDNPDKLPDEWPVSVVEVTDDSVLIQFPQVEMTVLEYEQYRVSYQPVYDAWELSRELEVARAACIEKLWQAAYDYNFQFFSGGAYAQILELKLAGFQRAIETQGWILSLWGDYYTRKYMASVAASLEQLEAVSFDFSNNQAPPWTVPEMLAEVAMRGS